MAKLQVGKNYTLETVDREGKWDPVEKIHSPTPETSEFVLFKTKEDLIKKTELSTTVKLPEGCTCLILETAFLGDGSIIANAFFSPGYGGWVKLNPNNWKKVRVEQIVDQGGKESVEEETKCQT